MTSTLSILSKDDADWLASTMARRRAEFGGFFMEAGGDGGGSGDGAGDQGGAGDGGAGADDGAKDQGFTQADVDRIVADRVKRERAKYADYDDLKKAAGDKATAEERIASLEKEIEGSKREALRRRVQAAHGISDEDADLFLTASDEETLKRQAERLAAQGSQQKKRGNRVPGEGTSNRPSENDERAAVRNLFGSGS